MPATQLNVSARAEHIAVCECSRKSCSADRWSTSRNGMWLFCWNPLTFCKSSPHTHAHANTPNATAHYFISTYAMQQQCVYDTLSGNHKSRHTGTSNVRRELIASQKNPHRMKSEGIPHDYRRRRHTGGLHLMHWVLSLCVLVCCCVFKRLVPIRVHNTHQRRGLLGIKNIPRKTNNVIQNTIKSKWCYYSWSIQIISMYIWRNIIYALQI